MDNPDRTDNDHSVLIRVIRNIRVQKLITQCPSNLSGDLGVVF